MLLAIANFAVSSRSRFARNIILVENNSFRSSQLTRSGGTLATILYEKYLNINIYLFSLFDFQSEKAKSCYLRSREN